MLVKYHKTVDGKDKSGAIAPEDIESAVTQIVGEVQPSAYHLSAVLSVSGWTLNNNLHEYTYLNSMFTDRTFVIVSFELASVEIARMADFMPINTSINGGLKVFAKNQPLADISINITVTGIVQADPGIAELLDNKQDINSYIEGGSF